MNVTYYKDPIGNFGDDLNEWIWDEIAPFIRDKESIYSLLGIGSIINNLLIKDEKVIVFGSGIGYGEIPNKEDLIINCVRGKLTARLLVISESLAVADSAILLNLIPSFSPIPENERDGVIFILHHTTALKSNYSEICDKLDIELVSPILDSKHVINKIGGSKLVIAESMHAAIVADAMRVNWIPVVANSNTNTFKWLDWLSTFEINYKPIYIGLPDLIAERNNNLLIKYNMALFKPNYSNMNEKQLLSSNQKNICYRLHKMLIKIQNKLTTKKTKENHKNKTLLLLANAMESQPYLSNDSVFYKNLAILKQKLNELESQILRL